MFFNLDGNLAHGLGSRHSGHGQFVQRGHAGRFLETGSVCGHLLHAFASQFDGFVDSCVSAVAGQGDALDVVAAEFLLGSQGVGACFSRQALAGLLDGAFPALVHEANHTLIANAVGVDDVLGGVAVGGNQVGGDGGQGGVAFGVHGDFLKGC